MADSDETSKLTLNELQFRDWSSLPADILTYISSRLFFLDYHSFANVCTSWKSAKAPLPPQMPFLFLRKQYFSPKPLCNLLNFTDNVSTSVHMPILGGKVCIGSQHGWLILVDNNVYVISLYNPLSRQEIKLPTHVNILASLSLDEEAEISESDLIKNWFTLKKVVLAFAPSSTASVPAAAALFDSGHFMYRRDGEHGWTLLLPELFVDITCWRGSFVGVTYLGDVYKLDLDVPEPKFQYIGEGTPEMVYKHLVTLNNDLLVVWWFNDIETRVTTRVKIMQLDPQRFIWIVVDDLCGHSLFLGTSHSLALSSQHIPGLKDNLIYIIHDLWGDYPGIDMPNLKHDIGVFNVRNGTYEICQLSNTQLPSSISTFWYVPPFSLSEL